MQCFSTDITFVQKFKCLRNSDASSSVKKGFDSFVDSRIKYSEYYIKYDIDHSKLKYGHARLKRLEIRTTCAQAQFATITTSSGKK